MKVLRILLLTLSFCFFATSAYAYIDPGTGSLIIQLVIGAIAAASLLFKSFWFRVKEFFSVFHSSSSSTTSTSPEPSDPIQNTSDGNSSEDGPPKNNTSSS